MYKLTDRNHWEKRYSISSAFSPHTVNMKWLRRYLYHRLDRLLRLYLHGERSYESFLEVGCGGGKWLVYFAKHFGYTVFGVDYSSRGVQKAREAVLAAGVDATIYHSDIFEWYTQHKESFDLVLSDGFIEHFTDTDSIIGMLNSMVKPSGTLVTLTPNLTGLHAKILQWVGKYEDVMDGHQAIHIDDLIQAYQNEGFEEIQMATVGSMIPKVISIPLGISRILNGILRGLAVIGIFIEGKNLSSTYIVIGKKSVSDGFYAESA